MHLPQVQIYAVIDALLKGDVTVILVTAVSIVNILPLLCVCLWLQEPVNVCLPFQFYQEELGQERLRIEQEMQVGSEFWSTDVGHTSWPFRCCFKALHWGSEQHHRAVKHLFMQCDSNKIHIWMIKTLLHHKTFKTIPYKMAAVVVTLYIKKNSITAL